MSHYPQNGTFCPEIRDSLFNENDVIATSRDVAGQNKADFRFQRPKLPLIPDFQRNCRNFNFGTFFPPGTQTGTKTGKGLSRFFHIFKNLLKVPFLSFYPLSKSQVSHFSAQGLLK